MQSVMEFNIVSDESSDAADLRTMKNQLIEFGLEEENLSKEEMSDLLKALNNSKSVPEETTSNQTVSESTSAQPKSLKRYYKNVKDRRMPWSLLPSDITQTEKARVLSVYIKLMSISKYWQARQISTFASWPPPISIVEDSGSKIHSLRSTRSGRNVPIYSELIDDDSSDTDFVVTKPKKRKISENDSSDRIYVTKVINSSTSNVTNMSITSKAGSSADKEDPIKCLPNSSGQCKRKQTKSEVVKPMKEFKLNLEDKGDATLVASSSVRSRRDKILAMVED